MDTRIFLEEGNEIDFTGILGGKWGWELENQAESEKVVRVKKGNVGREGSN